MGGIDRGLVMLPWIPVPPSVPRILLELVWVPWAIVAAVRSAADLEVTAAGSGAEPVMSGAPS
jgi:hypothetical protein